MLTDTHAHLDYPEFAADTDAVLTRAAAAGVDRVISIGTSLASSRRAVALAEQFHNVWATVGIHPTSVDSDSFGQLGELRDLARHPRVVAVGEIGLDYHWLPSETARREGRLAEDNRQQFATEDESNKIEQKRLFIAQMEVAREAGLNVVIHQRAAWEATLELLALQGNDFKAVYHCFTEPWSRAQQVLALGHLVSFTGIITFKNAAVAQETVAQVPTGSFMVETDAPYLAPVPHRGKPCEPAFTRLVAEQVARLRATSLKQVASETEETANQFFFRRG